MEKNEIFTIIQDVIQDVLPEVNESAIKLESSLVDLGANSIDRSEIIMQSMMNLGVKASLVDVGKIKSIDELVDFYHQQLT